MNLNIRKKTSHSRQAFRVHIRSFLLQDRLLVCMAEINVNELLQLTNV